MPRSKKIIIDYVVTTERVFDFGNLDAVPMDQKRQMGVDQDFWSKYLEARKNFEILHRDLIKQTKVKFGIPGSVRNTVKEIFRQLEPWGVTEITLDGVPYKKGHE